MFSPVRTANKLRKPRRLRGFFVCMALIARKEVQKRTKEDKIKNTKK